MNEKEYRTIINRIIPSTISIKRMVISFLVGGTIGVIGQLLIIFYSSFEKISINDAGNLMMVTLIFFSSLFTCMGFFDHLVTKAGAGLIIPITGFAHSTASSALEYKKEGFVNGIGTNIFKLSGSVILYGVLSAYIFGIIRYIIFGG